jgi:hypothetical protein
LDRYDLAVRTNHLAFAGAMTGKRRDDPVYKKNLQRLIEHHRQFEDAQE